MKNNPISRLIRKWTALLLSLCLCFTCTAAFTEAEGGLPEETEAPETEEAPDGETESGDDALPEEPATEEEPETEEEFPDELIVGHPTITNGDFFTEMFGNDTSDIDVRALIHGYNLVNWDQAQGVYVIDTSVVSSCKVMTDGEGNKEYFLSLWDDLRYSDGSPITAWDYAFSLLLMMAPEIEGIGGRIYRAEHILGYDEYITRKLPYLTGVNVIDDHQIVITLDHEFLPYFFETGLLLCEPYPISVIAPGCKVYDDGYGVYIGNEDRSVTEPLFTAELLKETILDPETGYNSHPAVSCGPYVLTEYDGTTARFEKNPFFKGTMDGVVPTIEKIRFTVADNNTLVQQLKDGELHLVNKVVYAPTIQEGMQASGEGIRSDNYPRIGLMCLTFTYDWPTVHDERVRQAIAWCMDRDRITADYCGGFGVRMDGFFGMEQWEYQLVTGRLPYPIAGADKMTDEELEAAEAEWEALSLNLVDYHVDTDRANRLLDEAGWTLNREGAAWRPSVDDVRCKMIDGELKALDLTMMYPAGNHVTDTLQENFIDHLNECGILLTLVPEDMQELLNIFYREKERTTDMIYLATNFHVIVDPAIAYSTDTTANHEIWNNTYSDDEELYQLAVDMRKTPPGSTFEYVQKWIRFQERFNKVLPAIPIYSNIYFDFFTEKLQNYHITAHVTWTQAILESYFGPAAEEEAESGEETEEDEDVTFFD